MSTADQLMSSVGQLLSTASQLMSIVQCRVHCPAMRRCVARSAALLAAALVALVTPGGASVPVQLLPFINYYEVYLEPYSGLTQKLRGVSTTAGQQPDSSAPSGQQPDSSAPSGQQPDSSAPPGQQPDSSRTAAGRQPDSSRLSAAATAARQAMAQLSAEPGNASCLFSSPHLHCYRQRAGPWPPAAPGAGPWSDGGPWRLVCASTAGPERAAGLYGALVALTGCLVPLVVVLNLAVVVTVLSSRRLHTVINALVVVLCASNVLWAALPVHLSAWRNAPVQCRLRTFLFVITRGISSTAILGITVLRYLLVVRNRSFSASRRNVAAAVGLAVLPSLGKWLLRRGDDKAGCQPVLAWSPDGFPIIARFERALDPVLVAASVSEYAVGLLVLGFCYSAILVAVVRSKRRVAGAGGAPHQPGAAAAGSGGPAAGRPQGSEQDSGSAPTPRQPPATRTGDKVRLFVISKKADAPAVPCPMRASQSGPLTNTNPNTSRPAVQEPSAARPERPALLSVPKRAPPAHQSPNRARTTALEPSSQSASSEAPPSPASSASQRSGDFSSTAPRPGPPGGSAARPGPPGGSAPWPGPPGGSAPRPGPPGGSAPRLGPPGGGRPAPARRPAGRVDLVATVSLSVFVVVLFVTIFPYVVSLGVINARAECVLSAAQRVLVSVVVVASMGAAAVGGPLATVLFSADFRRAFGVLCRRLRRALTGR
ncbi:hypothetical protein FJT64_016778 [Amphibalanus amphitrite]|uniref:G-protein coupled receptors family 1 profile domain-containing protein n=1 Tax=Amphibalanus amphitrite TaxID=1232801 RepID=A0A6A4X8Y6_AMPAM|nr:hypothetical protein FJT64_016778 [Amphibalanus amphitrite]